MQNRRKKQILLAVFLLNLLFSLNLMAKIKIGIVLPKSGIFNKLGSDAERGFNFAQKRITSAKDFEILIEDNNSENIETTNKAHKLINQDKVQILIGEISAYKTQLISPITDSKKIPLISLSPNNKENSKSYLGISISDKFQGEAMARFAFNQLKKKTVLILTDTTFEYSKILSKSFKNEFLNLGGKLASTDDFYYSSKENNLKNLIPKIKINRPDVIFIPGMYDEIPAFISEARDAGIKSIFLGGDGWDSPILLEKNQEKLNGSFYITNYSPLETNPKTLKFIREFEMTYSQKPGLYAFLAFDAINLLGEAFKNKENIDYNSFISTISTIKNFRGVSGVYSINSQLELNKTAYILEIEGPKTVLKTIVEPN